MVHARSRIHNSQTLARAYLSGVDAFFSMVTAEGLGQIFAFAAVFEWYEMTHKDGKWNGNNALQVTKRTRRAPPPLPMRTTTRTAMHRDASRRARRRTHEWALSAPLWRTEPTPLPGPTPSPPHLPSLTG